MKSIRFLSDFYAVDGSGNSKVKYAAGQSYLQDEETTRLAVSGIAEEVDVPDPVAAQDQPAAPDQPAVP